MKLRAADLFCGGGGTSAGAESTGEAEVIFALNHWDMAIKTHSANFPRCRHVNSRLEMTSPSEADRINLLFASPECTHHSRARGGKPTSDQQRSGAWYCLPWIEHHRPTFAVFENVVEFKEWGPVSGDGKPLVKYRGKFFEAWLEAIRSAGYRVDHQELNAADFGAATSRNRLFVIARKGNRNPVFPEPTHARRTGGELPGLGLKPWRSAAEIIDWSIPCPSIFTRKRPLADATLLRIEAGLRKFVGPYQVILRNNMSAADMDSSVSTITAGGIHHGIAVPFRVDVNHSGGDRSADLHKPLGTGTAKNGTALVSPFVLSTGSTGAPRSTDQPIPTIVTKDATALYIPWMQGYYGNSTWAELTSPIPTITTKDRHSVCVAQIGVHNDSFVSESDAMRKLRDTMRDLGVCDIGFRMFTNPELAAAQGFEADYIFHGTRADVTRQIGNSVSPNAAMAITQALLSA